MFDVTSLESIALSRNCFTGKLSAAMCNAHEVEVLSMDGLGNKLALDLLRFSSP